MKSRVQSNGSPPSPTGHELPRSVAVEPREVETASPLVTAFPTDSWSAIDLTFMNPSSEAPPALPIEVLPPSLSAMIRHFSQSRALSLDYVAGAVLAACSGAIGNRVRVRTFDGRAEPMALFLALVGPPSCGKTEAVGVVEDPLVALDGQLQGRLNASSPAKTSTKLHGRIKQIVQERLALEGFEADEPDNIGGNPGLLLHDATGPGLLEELRAGCAGRMLIANELVGVLSFHGPQKNKSRTLILEGYDGKPRIVVNKIEGKVFIPSLLITILGVVQPDRIVDMLGSGDDGLSARILWVYPEVQARTQLPAGSGPTVELQTLLANLVGISPSGPPGPDYSHLIPLAEATRPHLEAAAGRWAVVARLMESRLRATASRASQQAIRLAGLIAVSEQAASGGGLPVAIDESEVLAAIRLVDTYAIPMARRALAETRPAQECDAARLARHLAFVGKSVINLRADLHRGLGSPIRDLRAVAEAVEELIVRGILRPASRAGRLGRPAGDYLVHPELLALRVGLS